MSSTDREYFDDMYAATSDPWNLATDSYERRKYALTVAALPNERYRRAFEPGCSIGVLSALLAERCERLLATDIVPTALDQAAQRLTNYPNVVVERRAIPDSWPDGDFDLVVLSELGYYFDVPTLDRVITKLVGTTVAGAHVVGVHWRGETNYPLRAQQVHDRLDSCDQLTRIVHHFEKLFVLDVWERTT